MKGISKIKNKISSNFLIYLFTGLLIKGINFILIPLYTRFFTPEEYGLISILKAFIAVVVSFIGFGMEPLYGIYFFNSENRKKDMRMITVVYSILAMLISIILISFYSLVSKYIFDGGVSIVYYIVIVLSLYIGFYSRIIINIYQYKQEAIKNSIYQLFYILGIVFFNILFIVFLKFSYISIFFSEFILNLVFLIIFLTYFLKKELMENDKKIFELDKKKVKEYLKIGLPTIPASFAYMGLNMADRFVLKYYVDIKEIGYYSLAYSFGILWRSLILNSFVNTYSPNLFEKYKLNLFEAEKYNKKIQMYYFLFAIPMVFLFWLIIKFIFPFLIGDKFQDAVIYIPIILFGYVFEGGCSFNNNFLVYNKKTNLNVYSFFIAFLVNLVLNIIVVPFWGTMGAAYTTFISFVVMFIVSLSIKEKYVFEIKKNKWEY